MPAKRHVFIFMLVVICVRLKITGEDCDFVINEVNTGSSERFEKIEFIELKMICDSEHPKTKTLQGYKLIGISADTEENSNVQQMSIDVVVNLWNSVINKQNMFTVGADGVKNTDMNCNSTSVTYRSKFTGNTQTLNSFLNNGNKHIHAIALLFNESYTFPEIVISPENPFIIINDTLQELIKSNLVDFIVYAENDHFCHNCNNLFTNLYNEYANKEYILREFDNSNEPEIDRTLNRCSVDRSTFSPANFKLGYSTPGEENDCSDVNFSLENHLPLLTNYLQNKSIDDNNIEHIFLVIFYKIKEYYILSILYPKFSNIVLNA